MQRKLSNSVILAAGYASRARPFSDYLPKPLFPVGDHCGLENAIGLSRSIGLEPIITVGNKGSVVKNYLNTRFPDVSVVEINNPSTNLLESVAACSEIVNSPNFLWIGAGMFFQDNSEINRLVELHKGTEAFCTMFYQEQTRYKPKLVIQDGVLVKFIVGENPTNTSTPTVFAVDSSFMTYAREYSEFSAFQRAIDDGLPFNLVRLNGWSAEIHTVDDLYKISCRLYPDGFVCTNSVFSDSSAYCSYIYNSKVLSSEIENSIIIDAYISNDIIVNRLIYRDIINEPIMVAHDG